MNQYPKWLLAISFPNVLIPIGTLIFFLFGGVTLFDCNSSTFLDVIQYILLQLFWLLPLASFFATLFLWGNAQERAAVVTTIVGLLISITSIALLWSQRNDTAINKPIATAVAIPFNKTVSPLTSTLSL